LGKLGKDKLSRFFYGLTLCSLVSFDIHKKHNQERLHSVLGCLLAVEFERGLHAQTKKEAASRQLPL